MTSDVIEYGKHVGAAHTAAQHATQQQLTGPGRLLADAEEFELTASALLRTRLLVVRTGGVFAATSRLRLLLSLIDIEDAIT